ncbi:MAG: TIGR03986 family CRISPR-associated RAMP protein [Ignavibacteria bacterium]|nr:TIGR03986 family CRISPR-associated RAMP protein [Ignavibacteria bacterium]
MNKKVVLSDFKICDIPFDKYHTERITGYIGLSITTLTPMYIRDNKDLNVDENTINSDFFSPANGKLRMPGSSFRGMLRNLVEIVSFGKFGNFDDKRLYMRGFADKTLGKEYRAYNMSAFSAGRVTYNMNSGLLLKNGNQYVIKDSGKPAQVTKENSKIKIGSSGTEFNFYDVGNEYIVVPGKMSKDRDWVITKPVSGCKEIVLLKMDIDDYKNDENRTDRVNLLEKLSSMKGGVPCFYIQWKDENNTTRTTFGHTGMFRLPYRRTIGEHIPDVLKDKKVLDIAEAIFGNETRFSGRIFVEDSFCHNSNKSEILIGETHPKILSGPKPTTFQHYLTQISEDVRELKHYNPDSEEKLSAIRGNKLYWHKAESEGWKETNQVSESDKQHTKINPVRKDTIFTGRIRFDNLSDVELGALLFALDLPKGCLHKIGMGKPLGLGSIKITPTLHLSDREKRYTDLFAEWSENFKELNEDNNTINDFKNKFAEYVLKQLNGDSEEYTFKNLWDEDRMKELKRMLDWENKPGKDLTRYMTIQPENEFKNRPVLPRPTDVKYVTFGMRRTANKI